MWDTRWSRVAAIAMLIPGGCYDGFGSEPDAGATDGGDASSAGPGSGGDDTGSTDGEAPPVECDGEILDPGPNLARRLTVREYSNTVLALTGVDIAEAATQTLPAELRADGFTNTASGLITTLAHVEGYDALAELTVERIPDLGAFASQYTSCLEYEASCKTEYVENLGLRAFRRPLDPEEVDLLVLVFDVAQDEGESFLDGAGLVLEAMMQSPPFLYRLEDETRGNQVRELDGYEMASRLSYLLWAGPPDEELLTAASDDSLRNDGDLETQVDRMLADPRAEEASVNFVRDWLHLARLSNLPRDPERFPDWSDEVAGAMVDETLGFFSSIAWSQQRPLVELFSAQETWLSPELASYYGLEPQGDAPVSYDVSAIPERGGLLTQGSLLTIGGDDSSMVARGLFIFENLLCQHPTSPPEGVDTTPPPLEPGKSQRDYSEERLDNSACAGCHLQFEPPAFGLERYLADGTYATMDSFGNELRQDGFIRLPGGTEVTYEEPAELMSALAEADAVRECLARKGTQFAAARPIVEADECSMGKVQERFAASAGTWRDLIVAIALSPSFRSLRVEEG